jgi:predicted secreted protein
LAKPTTLSAAKLIIQLGDGEVSEVFSAPCGLITKGISFTAEANDSLVPDCDNPDLASWTERTIRALSAGVTGSGVLATSALPIWQEYFFSAEAKNVRIKIDTTLALNGGHFAGSFVLTSFNITGELGDKIQVEVELQSNGEVVWVDASA